MQVSLFWVSWLTGFIVLPFKIQAHVPLRIKGRNGPLGVVMVVDGVKDLHHKRSLLCDNIYDRRSRAWCGRSDLLQTSNISLLLINLHHHHVRVGWLPLSWLAHWTKLKNVSALSCKSLRVWKAYFKFGIHLTCYSIRSYLYNQQVSGCFFWSAWTLWIEKSITWTTKFAISGSRRTVN